MKQILTDYEIPENKFADFRQLVERGIKKGWIRRPSQEPPEPPEKKQNENRHEKQR